MSGREGAARGTIVITSVMRAVSQLLLSLSASMAEAHYKLEDRLKLLDRTSIAFV